MEKNYTLLFLILMISTFSFSNEMELEGVYKGKNLYIQNPFSDKGGFCIQQIKVNGKITDDEIESSAFEIDFKKMNLKYGDALNIIITHKDACKPQIVNPEDIEPKEVFYIRNISLVKSNEKLKWQAKGKIKAGNFIVQQYRWKQWVDITTVKAKISEDFKNYEAQVYLHGGRNIFRIKQIDKNTKKEEFSKKKIIEVDKFPVTFLLTEITTMVLFSDKTFYQVFDEFGNKVLQDYGNKIEMLTMKNGKYFINYDQETKEIDKLGRLRKKPTKKEQMQKKKS